MTPWIQTYTGRAYPVTNPTVLDFCIEDIAHALANICRFNGHVRSFYSVAQHSYICSLFVRPELSKAALLHDASEAYITDIPKPLKMAKEMVGYRTIEARTELALAQYFNIPSVMDPEIKEVDIRALVTEQRDLMGLCEKSWTNGSEIKPLPLSIDPWTPKEAEAAFLNRYWAVQC